MNFLSLSMLLSSAILCQGAFASQDIVLRELVQEVWPRRVEHIPERWLSSKQFEALQGRLGGFNDPSKSSMNVLKWSLITRVTLSDAIYDYATARINSLHKLWKKSQHEEEKELMKIVCKQFKEVEKFFSREEIEELKSKCLKENMHHHLKYSDKEFEHVLNEVKGEVSNLANLLDDSDLNGELGKLQQQLGTFAFTLMKERLDPNGKWAKLPQLFADVREDSQKRSTNEALIMFKSAREDSEVGSDLESLFDSEMDSEDSDDPNGFVGLVDNELAYTSRRHQRRNE